jgi:hypothetical protein
LLSGKEIQVDVIVCATGYDGEAPPQFEVIDRDGLNITKRWEVQPESYLGLAVDGFPNFLMLGGPNTGLGSGSLTSAFEAQSTYIVKVLRKMQKEDCATFEVDARRVSDFSQFVDEYFKRTVFTDDCSTWYRSKTSGSSRIVALWPGASVHCPEALRSPRWEDFHWTSVNTGGNLLRRFGDGSSMTLEEGGDPSWFLDADVVDEPCEGKPEESEFYRRRPYTY